MNAFKKFTGVDEGSGSAAPASSTASAPKLSNILPAALTGQQPAANPTDDYFNTEACSLSKKQRMIGFGCCLAFGMLISLLSTLNIAKPTSFALLYSLGNIVSFMSTGFLVGPKRQFKYACERKRALATIIFFVSMIATLCVAMLYHGSGSTVLCVFLIIIQFCALVWYTASYIPFAQQAITSFVKSCFGRATGAATGG